LNVALSRFDPTPDRHRHTPQTVSGSEFDRDQFKRILIEDDQDSIALGERQVLACRPGKGKATPGANRGDEWGLGQHSLHDPTPVSGVRGENPETS
jgi:hypothetical protein